MDRQPRSYWRWVCLAAALAGLLASVQLAVVHLGGPQAAPAFVRALCGAGPSDGCEQVLRSPWAKIANLPAAAWGAAYFVVLAIWYVLIGAPDRPRRGWQACILAFTAAGSIASVWFTWIMLARLNARCPLCLFCHAMNVVLLLGAVLIWARAAPPKPDAPRPPWKLAAATIALGVSLGLLFLQRVQLGVVAARAQLFGHAYLSIVDDPQYVLWRWRHSPPLAVPVRSHDPLRGPARAPHQAIVFSDFQCPSCARLARVLDELLRKFPDSLQVVFKPLPLDQSCNERITPQQSIYPAGCQAARAAEAANLLAGAQGFWKLHDAMMANQHLVARRDFAQLARLAGLDADRLLQEMSSPQAAARVAEAIADAPLIVQPGAPQPSIPGTPLVILDGRRLEHWAVFRTVDGRDELDMPRTLSLWETLLAAPATQPAP